MMQAEWTVHSHRPLLSQTVLIACCQFPDFPGACLIISASMVILTSSPTTTPPLSRVAFHFTPKSWRLTLDVAVAAARTLPQGSFTGAVGPSTSRTTSLAVPRMVRSPVTFSLPGASCSTFLDLKVMVGKCATSKNLLLRRSLSRAGSRVSTVETSMVTSTVDLVTSLSSSTIVPLTLLKAPRTVEIAIWRTENCADECCGSIFHSEVAAAAGSERAAASPAVSAIRDSLWPMIFSSFVLIKTSKLVPERLLGRLADADFLQQIGKNLQACRRHMAELSLVKFANRLVHGF